MSRTINVRAVQVAYGDDETVEHRVERVAALVREQEGADLVVLPELWAPGYFFYSDWRARAEGLRDFTVAAIAAAAADIGAVVHVGSILETDSFAPSRVGATPMWNTSVVVGRDGRTLDTYRKIHPFGFGEGEPNLIQPGERPTVIPMDIATMAQGVNLGLATCYDLRFPELFRLLSRAGANVFAVPAAWPEARRDHWHVLGRARAIENQAIVVQVNTGGTHAGVHVGGGSQIVSHRGVVLARANDGDAVLTADADLDDLLEYRSSFPVLADRRL